MPQASERLVVADGCRTNRGSSSITEHYQYRQWRPFIGGAAPEPTGPFTPMKAPLFSCIVVAPKGRHELLVAQYRGGIGPRRIACGQHAGRERHEEHESRGPCQADGIDWTNAKQDARQNT